MWCFGSQVHDVEVSCISSGIILILSLSQIDRSANFILKAQTDVWWFITVFYSLHNSMFLLWFHLLLLLSVINWKQSVETKLCLIYHLAKWLLIDKCSVNEWISTCMYRNTATTANLLHLVDTNDTRHCTKLCVCAILLKKNEHLKKVKLV